MPPMQMRETSISECPSGTYSMAFPSPKRLSPYIFELELSFKSITEEMFGDRGTFAIVEEGMVNASR